MRIEAFDINGEMYAVRTKNMRVAKEWLGDLVPLILMAPYGLKWQLQVIPEDNTEQSWLNTAKELREMGPYQRQFLEPAAMRSFGEGFIEIAEALERHEERTREK